MKLYFYLFLIFGVTAATVFAENNHQDESHDSCPGVCIVPRDPVCGTDGKTYGSGCLLRKTACRSNFTIDLAYNGACDPCTNYTCTSPPYSTCTADNGVPKCTCPIVCPAVNDPVCGSDGRVYLNDCKLWLHACLTRRHIAVSRTGKCDDGKGRVDHLIAEVMEGTEQDGNSCASLQCSFPSICKQKTGQGAVCVTICPKVCPVPLEPVCASDGHMYDSECEMRRKSCGRTGRMDQLYVVKQGPCPVSDCPYSCFPSSVCKFVNGVANCVPICRQSCPENLFDPVCGSDGITYSNECELKRDACTRDKQLNVSHKGSCEELCVNFTCTSPPHSMCEVKGGKPVCGCNFDCPDEQHLLCGSDGNVYDNLCHLAEASCKQNKTITAANKTLCTDPCLSAPPCSEHQPYAKCRALKGVAKCVCTDLCKMNTTEPEPAVCGTDGVSYRNECQLKIASCTKNRTIEVFSSGPCIVSDPCDKIKCSNYATCRVIASSGKCVCPRDCPVDHDAICGSNGKTYDSECLMKKESCDSRQEIVVLHKGTCHTET